MRFPVTQPLAVAVFVAAEHDAADASVVVVHAMPTLAELCAVLLRATAAQLAGDISCAVTDGLSLVSLGEAEYAAAVARHGPPGGANAHTAADPTPMVAWLTSSSGQRGMDERILATARELLSTGTAPAVVLHVMMPGFPTPLAPGHELVVRQGEDPVWAVTSFCRRHYWDDSNEPALWKEVRGTLRLAPLRVLPCMIARA
jgi:hypothetical protein